MNEIYFNRPQQLVMYTAANSTVFVGGRRLGKSHGIAAPWLLRNFQRMRGCSIGIVASTYKRCLTNTLPGTLKAFEDWGYKRGVHWCIGIKPPKRLGFMKPIIDPVNYEHVLSFYDGSIAYIISQDRPGTSNSMTLDGVFGDESKFLIYQKLKDETFPANGGIKSHFGHCPWHHSTLFVSDMPSTKQGSWLLDYREKSDPELISVIHGLIFEIWKIETRIKEEIASGKTVKSYLFSRLKKLNTDLNRLRRVAVYYGEFSTIENLQLLGESYIHQMKRDLPPLTFQTSILCKRIGTMIDGFYSNLTHSHIYNATDFGYMDSLEYKFDKLKDESSLQDADINRDEPISIGMDYNGKINWIVAGQYDGRYINVVKSFYVKYNRLLKDLVDDFCHYYRHHRKKEVFYYYDTTALGNYYAEKKEGFKDYIKKQFENNGWKCSDRYVGNPMNHLEKHQFINRCFKGYSDDKQAVLIPKINDQNNEDLILALQSAGMRNGKKDKSGEKLAETEDDRLELRTDGTDAFDTLVIGMVKYPYISRDKMIVSSFI